MEQDVLDWILSGPSYAAYRTRLDLMGEAGDSPEVLNAGKKMEDDPQVVDLINAASEWFSEIPKRHDDAKMSHYRLRMLADFGFDITDCRIAAIVKRALVHTDDGLPAIRQALPEKGANLKPDESFDEWHALPCDATVLAATLYRLGCREPVLMGAISDILERWREPGGWFCHLFFVDSQYRKHGTPCMMAALQTLELLSELPMADVPDRGILRDTAFDALEAHHGMGRSLYYFGRGRKFHTLKYPYAWYNALYMAEVLSRFPELHDRPLVRELRTWLEDSRADDGSWTPTSMFMAYRDWDFADKKNPSPWLTFLCLRILGRFFGS